MYATSHKKPFVPSVGGIDYYVLICTMYRQKAKSVLGTSVKVINWVSDTFRWFWNFCEKFVVRGREF